MSESRAHKILKQVGLRWIQATGCVAFACEVRWGWCGIVDACGVKANGDVYIVEAKVSTVDLRSDTKDNRRRGASKIWKFRQSRNDIDFVYYIVADGVDISSLPEWIGILNENGVIQRRAQRRKPTNSITKAAAFEKLARALSWRAYGHIIRHEQEQPKFSLMRETNNDTE